MKLYVIFLLISSLCLMLEVNAQSLLDANHPGSKFYDFGFEEKRVNCNRRQVWVYLPKPLVSGTAVIAFGHGQSLDESHYKQTYLHLAQKGVAVIHTDYSSGFFDTNWTRMAKDYINQIKCILDQTPELNSQAIVFSGHSKGAYVAGVASGMAFKENLNPKPASVFLMNSAGVIAEYLSHLDPSVEMTVVFSDKDRIVDQDISDDLYRLSPSVKKQFIMVKSYPASSGQALDANHFWPLTKRSLLGGTTENLLHYYGSWKWLTAAAIDANSGAEGLNPFLYGPFTADKGVNSMQDFVDRSF